MPTSRDFDFLLIFIIVRIFALLSQTGTLLAWSNASRVSFKADLYFNWAQDLPPYRPLPRIRRVKSKKIRKNYHGNLAFGARGPPCIRKGNGNGNSTLQFDQTKGFPGEGWPKLKIVT